MYLGFMKALLHDNNVHLFVFSQEDFPGSITIMAYIT